MATTFHLTIAKVGERVFDGAAVSVQLPGVDGMFTVLAHHEAFVTELKAGEARIRAADGSETRVPVPGGVAEISNNQATVIL